MRAHALALPTSYLSLPVPGPGLLLPPIWGSIPRPPVVCNFSKRSLSGPRQSVTTERLYVKMNENRILFVLSTKVRVKLEGIFVGHSLHIQKVLL